MRNLALNFFCAQMIWLCLVASAAAPYALILWLVDLPPLAALCIPLVCGAIFLLLQPSFALAVCTVISCFLMFVTFVGSVVFAFPLSFVAVACILPFGLLLLLHLALDVLSRRPQTRSAWSGR